MDTRTHIDFAHPEIKPFLIGLQSSTRSKIGRLLDSLARHGYELGMPHAKAIGNGMMELRVRGTQEVRLLYVLTQQQAIILHAFVKKTDEISSHDLDLAIRRKKLIDVL